MIDCCASSSRNHAAAATSAALPSFVVRPGVTFPDWSVVTSSAVRDTLQVMVGSEHVLNRWSGYEPTTDRVRGALLQIYAESGRAPTPDTLAERAGLSETAVRPLLQELRGRDLVVLDGEQIVGAYPFTGRDTGHRVTLDGRVLNAMCSGIGQGAGAVERRGLRNALNPR